MIMTTEERIELVRNALKSCARGIEFLMNNPRNVTETNDLLRDVVDNLELSNDLLVQISKSFTTEKDLKNLCYNYLIDKHLMQKFQEWTSKSYNRW